MESDMAVIIGGNGLVNGKFDASIPFLLLTLFLTNFTIHHRQQTLLVAMPGKAPRRG
jgi:hypothetical protein